MTRRAGGFTLFEIIVAITIVALLMGVVVSRMDDYLDLDMKKSSRRMASTMRYLYNKSATEGIFIRLIIDMNEQTYWVEATREPFIISKVEGLQESKEEEEAAAEAVEETEEMGEVPEGEVAPIQLPKLKIKKPTFSQEESYLLRPQKLPDRVRFKDVMTEHHPNPVEGGQAAVYFFPNGYVEYAIINLTDEDEEAYYSLETNPITGSVNIESEYRTIEKK